MVTDMRNVALEIRRFDIGQAQPLSEIEKNGYCPIVYAGLRRGGGAGRWIRKKDGRMRLQEKYKVIVVRFEALGLATALQWMLIYAFVTCT